MQLWHREDSPKIAMIYGANIHPDINEAELKLAARYDLIIGGLHYGDTDISRQKTNDHIKRIHEMNPRSIVLHYVGGACEQRTDNPFFDHDCFLKTTEGESISSWPGSHMLNLTKQKTIDALTRHIIHTHSGAADGMYIDCMGGSFDGWVVEIATGKQVKVDADGDGMEDDLQTLNRAWLEGKENLLKTIREQIGAEPYILVNGGMANRYAKPYADGNIFEGIWDSMSIPAAYAHHSFSEILEACRLWSGTPSGRQNCSYIDITPGIDCEFNIHRSRPPAENSRLMLNGYESLRQMRYGLAMTLLTDIHFTFQLHTRCLGQYWWYPEYDLPIGKPLSGCYLAEDGSWRRDYENAVVVANITYHEVQPHFDAKMRDGTMGLTGRDFDLPSKDGRIYMRMGKEAGARVQ
jgi:hypothetical protein